MRRLGLTAALLLVAVLCGVTNGATRLPGGMLATDMGRDSCGGGVGIFGSAINTRGPVMYWAENPSGTDTIERGEVVGFVRTVITVVTKYNVGAAYDTATIASKIQTSLDTMIDVPREQGGGAPYDSSKNSQYFLRLVVRRPGAGANDTVKAAIHGYDNAGVARWIRWQKTGATAAYDTILTQFALAQVDSVYLTGDHLNDSFALYAEPLLGVGVNTVLGSATDTNFYVGVAQSKIYPRRRGPIQRHGPGAVVKVNASTTDVKNGMWLTPSATSGYAAASTTMPILPIGFVTHYSQANGLATAMLAEPFYSVSTDTTLEYRVDTLEAICDSLDSLVQIARDSANQAMLNAASADGAADTALAAAREIWFQEFGAGQFVIPAAGGPALIQTDGTNFAWDCLAFDTTAVESASIVFSAPQLSLTAIHDSLRVEIWWVGDTSAQDTVRWGVDFNSCTPATAWDTTLGFGGWDYSINGGNGKLNWTAKTYVATGLGSTDIITCNLSRVASVSQDNYGKAAKFVKIRFSMWR
jgi:hypothetical protein